MDPAASVRPSGDQASALTCTPWLGRSVIDAPVLPCCLHEQANLLNSFQLGCLKPLQHLAGEAQAQSKAEFQCRLKWVTKGVAELLTGSHHASNMLIITSTYCAETTTALYFAVIHCQT